MLGPLLVSAGHTLIQCMPVQVTTDITRRQKKKIWISGTCLFRGEHPKNNFVLG